MYSATRHPLFWRRIFFKGFYYIWAWRPSWSMDGNHFSNLPFPCPRKAPNEIWATLAQRLQRRSHLKFSTFLPYKCIGKQTWPHRKKVKCQCTTITLATLVTSRLRWYIQRFSQKASSVVEKTIFKGFNHIWAWPPSWSMDRNHFSSLSFACPRKAPNEIWATLAQRLHKRTHLKFWTFFPYKCIEKQTLACHKKGQISMYDHYFSNFCRTPVPDDLCKDSAKRHLRFWRRRFLKVFSIYGHGGHLGQQTVTILAIFRSPNLRRLQMKFEQNCLRGFRGEVIWKC